MLPLLVALVAVMWIMGMNYGGLGVHDLLHPWDLYLEVDLWPVEYSRYLGIDSPALPGIELTIVPLAAIAAARLRLGADWISSLRERAVAPTLPLWMALTLIGVIGYVVWSWGLPQAEFGPHEFGIPRWFGAGLLAAFAWFWWPLFPRVTAKLAGMIGGPALFAGIGYLFYADVIKNEPTGYCEGSCVTVLMVYLFIVFALELAFFAIRRLRWSPLAHAVWTGVLMAALAALGTGP